MLVRCSLHDATCASACTRGAAALRAVPLSQLAQVQAVGLDLGTTLVGSGIYNLYSGAAFGVPMPVQPMKSIAAVAITDPNFGLHELLLAGVMVSAFVLLLAFLRLIPGAGRHTPGCSVRTRVHRCAHAHACIDAETCVTCII